MIWYAVETRRCVETHLFLHQHGCRSEKNRKWLHGGNDLNFGLHLNVCGPMSFKLCMVTVTVKLDSLVPFSITLTLVYRIGGRKYQTFAIIDHVWEMTCKYMNMGSCFFFFFVVLSSTAVPSSPPSPEDETENCQGDGCG